MNRSEQIGELAAALATAQAKIAAAPKENTAKVKGKLKDGTPYEYTYSYSTLADVWEACRAPLAASQLAVIQTVVAKGNQVTVATMLAHASGQWVSEDLTLSAADERPQSVGSAITYGRRYALGSIVGVVSEEDDDGNTANGNDHQTTRRPPVKTNGNHSKPPASTRTIPAQAGAPLPPEEQLYATLSEALPPDWTKAEMDEWMAAHLAEVAKLPGIWKDALRADALKVPVRS